MKIEKERILIALQSALLGEIYQEIRAICYSYDSKEKTFLIRYYLNREPNESDYESVSEVMTEFISNFKYSDFVKLKEECQYSDLPNSKLDSYDGFVYLKRESNLT